MKIALPAMHTSCYLHGNEACIGISHCATFYRSCPMYGYSLLLAIFNQEITSSVLKMLWVFGFRSIQAGQPELLQVWQG